MYSRKVTICVTNDKNIENVVTEDVLYVPELAANLLSVSKITKKGYKISFEKEDCAIVDEEDNVIAKGQRRNTNLKTWRKKQWLQQLKVIICGTEG